MADAATTTLAEPGWLAARRERAGELTGSLALPTTRSAGWEFTDLAGLDLDGYPAAEGGEPDALNGLEPLLAAPAGGIEIQQVDACPVGPLDAEPGGDEVIVMALAEAVARHPELVERHFGTIVSPEDPFVARNEAAWAGGAFVYVPRGARLDAPVRITAAQAASGRTLSWRTLIVLEEGAEAEVWEQYLSAAEDVDGVFNTVVEISVGPAAHLRYVCGQGLSERSWIFGSQRAEVDRDATLEWVALGFGSAHGKLRMETKLAGKGANARVTGAYAGHARQHLDFDTTQEHAAESTTSDLAFRGVLQDRATAVWRGMIRVDPGAQRTDAFQESRNLLLSKRAHADALPGLEIKANDVRCTHAAAIAQVEEDHLYYLMSRGLSRDGAKRLVIEGFMQALVDRFDEGPIRAAVSDALQRRLEAVLA